MQYFNINNAFIAVFSFFILTINAQFFPSKNISVIDGLPNNQVETILKDSRGILWIGTNNGLSKIENGQIINFDKSDGLAHNSVWDIIEDKYNNIWIASYGGGVTKYNGSTFSVFNTKKGLANNHVRKLFQYKDQVFVGTKNGLSIINTINDGIITFDAVIEDFQIMDFFVNKGVVYCGIFRKGIFKIDIENKRVKKVFDYQDDSDFLFSIYAKDSLFYYSVDGANHPKNKGSLKKFSTDNLLTNKREDLLFGKSIVWDYATDNNNNLYAAAWGVYTNDGGIFQIKNNKFIDRSLDFGVDSNNIKCLYFDKEFNILYVGSIDKGMYIVDLNERISFYQNHEYDVVDIAFSEQNIALLNKTGLTIINNNNDVVKHIPNSDFLNFSIKSILKNPSIPKEICEFRQKEMTVNDVVYYKILYKDASYWISSYLGLFQLDMAGNILKHNILRAKEFEFDYSGNLIYPIPYTDMDIVYDLDNYVGNTQDGVVKRYSFDDPNTPVEVSSFVKSKAKIYISTLHKGLFVYENETIQSLNEIGVFNEMELTHLALMKQRDRLAIATASGDIYFADIAKDFKIINKVEKELLEGDSVLFLETYQDYIIIGTNKGITICKNEVNQFIDEAQGLKERDFTSSTVINNKLIVGTEKGYYVMDLSKIINPNPVEIDLKINHLAINYKEIDDANYKWFKYDKKELELKHFQNTLTLDFETSNHPYPNKLRYKFRVEGIDTTWSKYSDKTTIFLFHIPHGKFDVSVKVKDLHAAKITTTKLLSIVITPPYWKNWWFIVGTILFLMLIIFVLHKIRTNTIKKREIQKSKFHKRLAQTKLEALQSQMNPHFIFNAMNSIQNYIIDNDIDNALMYLSEFAKLIRKTLENSSKPLITLAEEISYLKLYTAMENMRFENRVEVSIHDNGLNTNNILTPPMLIQPFVENCFVHAFDSSHKHPKISINFSKEGRVLKCVIVDNGKGMLHNKSEQLYDSKGLKLVSERLKLLNKSANNNLEIKTEKDRGTSVQIYIHTDDKYST